MRRIPRFLGSARGAWETLTDFPLPESFPVAGDTDGEAVLPWFPLLGALCGAAIAGLGMLAALLTNPIAGATVFALAALAFLILKDSGRGILLLVSLLDLRLERGSFAAALPDVSADRSILTGTRFAGFAAGALAVLEFIALFLLCSRGSALFLVTVLTGSFAVQGMLATGGADADSQLIPDADGIGRKRMLILAGLIAAFSLWLFPVASAFAVAVFCLLAFGFAGAALRNVEAVTPELVTLAGALTEAGVLVCGFLWTL